MATKNVFPISKAAARAFVRPATWVPFALLARNQAKASEAFSLHTTTQPKTPCSEVKATCRVTERTGDENHEQRFPFRCPSQNVLLPHALQRRCYSGHFRISPCLSYEPIREGVSVLRTNQKEDGEFDNLVQFECVQNSTPAESILEGSAMQIHSADGFAASPISPPTYFV